MSETQLIFNFVSHRKIYGTPCYDIHLIAIYSVILTASSGKLITDTFTNATQIAAATVRPRLSAWKCMAEILQTLSLPLNCCNLARQHFSNFGNCFNPTRLRPGDKRHNTNGQEQEEQPVMCCSSGTVQRYHARGARCKTLAPHGQLALDAHNSWCRRVLGSW